MKLLSQQKSFAGNYQRYSHVSSSTKCEMVFSIYLPPQAIAGKSVPLLYWLSGLTCTDENFMQKAGAHCIAAQLGVAIVAPDTSPRGKDVPDDPEAAYDMGLGAGFYVDATQEPWAEHYQMYSYIVDELPKLLHENFLLNGRAAISGHSMGGHGALTIALKNPQKYTSVSAFSPIVSPTQCPWGVKALSQYLGHQREAWVDYDACLLLDKAEQHIPMMIDQGLADNFLEEQLKTELLVAALDQKNYQATVRMQQGYDHSYYFIASFFAEHLQFHMQYLSE